MLSLTYTLFLTEAGRVHAYGTYLALVCEQIFSHNK